MCFIRFSDLRSALLDEMRRFQQRLVALEDALNQESDEGTLSQMRWEIDAWRKDTDRSARRENRHKSPDREGARHAECIDSQNIYESTEYKYTPVGILFRIEDNYTVDQIKFLPPWP